MGRFDLRVSLGALAGLLVLAGCNARPVTRAEETERFRSRMDQQLAGLDLDVRRRLTMGECEQIAVGNSLDLSVRRLALRLEDDQVRLAASGWLPKGSLQYASVDRSNDANVRFGDMTASFEDKHQERLAIQAAVPALDWGLTYYAYKNAVDRRSQERLVLARAEQLLRRDVRVAYAQHAGAIRQERLAGLALQAAQQVLRVAKSLERAELTVRADTALVDSAVAQAALVHSLAKQRVEGTHLQLSQLMSLPPGTDFEIDPDLPPLPAVLTAGQLAAYEDRALNVRPELAVADLQRHISANTVRQTATEFFPRVDGIGSFNWSNNSMAVNPSYYLFGFQVAHSLLDGGATIFRYSLAKKTATLEQERTLLISLGILYEVQLRALEVRQAHDTIEAAAVLHAANQAALDRVISLYKEGLEDEAGAARALAELTTQATALDRAQTNYLVAWQELLAAALPVEAPPTTRPTTQPATRPAGLPPGIPVPLPWGRGATTRESKP